jgi:DNA-binding CsgD family transcriptional regulator
MSATATQSTGHRPFGDDAGHRSNAIVERATEVGVLESAITGAVAGRGSAILLEAAPGLGKSRMIDYAEQLALATGADFLRARGSELETSFAFGAVRQLLEGPLAALAESDRERLLTGAAGLAAPVLAERRRRPRPGQPDPATSGLHGLYWLTANLARKRPLVLCVDDAHWIDEPSLRWLVYLAARIADLPVALVLATRRVRQGAISELLHAYERSPSTSVITPEPLSPAGVSQLIGQLLGVTPEDDFVTACHELTAGSPLLLVELLRSLESEGLQPTTEEIRRLFTAGPASLSRAALARLRGLPPGAVELARAIAILERSSVRAAANLSGVQLADAERAAHALVEVGVLADALPLEFVHPLIRSCVYADMSAPVRASAHLRAAALLAGAGADAERVAGHLLHSEPSHEDWALETLRRASEIARSRGAPEIAVGYLRRALIEFPVAQRRASVLLELGRAEVRAGNAPAGIDHLRRASELAESRDARTDATTELITALTASGRAHEAAQLSIGALAHLGVDERESGLRLAAQLAVAAWDDPTALDMASIDAPPFVADLDRPSGVGDRLAMVVEAVRASLDNRFDRAAELARGSLAGGLLAAALSPEDPALVLPATALLYAERPGWAADVLNELLVGASRQGSRPGVALLSACRGLASLRAGRLDDAALDARSALEIGAGCSAVVALAVLTETLVDQGQLEEAADLSGRHTEVMAQATGLFSAHLYHAVGRLREAQERWTEAEAAFRACGAVHLTYGVSSPAASPWRGHLAIVIAADGRLSEARTLAGDAVGLAQGGDSLLALGTALRAAGLLESDAERRAELLREAVAILAETEARLELARAQIDLGSDLRRAGLRREASATLAEAHHLAHQLGARPLAERGRTDLVVLGAKPRRRDGDRDALTAAELRVAALAAQGATNRRIAADLFITAKTVEYHLTSIYRKLDISSREELPVSLVGSQAAA